MGISPAVYAYGEAAIAKLYYLLSCGYPKDKIEELMEKDLCGELDE